MSSSRVSSCKTTAICLFLLLVVCAVGFLAGIKVKDIVLVDILPNNSNLTRHYRG